MDTENNTLEEKIKERGAPEGCHHKAISAMPRTTRETLSKLIGALLL